MLLVLCCTGFPVSASFIFLSLFGSLRTGQCQSTPCWPSGRGLASLSAFFASVPRSAQSLLRVCPLYSATPTASLPKVRLRSSGWWLSQTASGSRSSPSLVLGYYVLSWQQSSSNWGIRQVTEDVPSSEKRRWGARTGCPTCLPTSGSDQRGQGAYTEGMAARALRPSRCLTTTFSLCKKRSRQH